MHNGVNFNLHTIKQAKIANLPLEIINFEQYLYVRINYRNFHCLKLTYDKMIMYISLRLTP